jgi:MFS family permease
MIASRTNRQRSLIALVQILGLSVWFSVSVVVPSIRAEWGFGSTASGWLTASVQIGFAAGAIASALLHLADRIAPQHLLAAGAACAAACTAAMALLAHDLCEAIPLRFLTGVALAVVYPVGMKLMASWSESTDRGRWFGILIGSLALGSAFPQLISGFAPLPWRSVTAIAAALSAVGAVIAVAALMPGPHLDTRPVALNPRYVIAMFAERGVRLTNVGYFGHMWELYALWTWLPLFLLAGRQERGDEVGTSTGIIAFFAIGIAGAAGSVLGGLASDRFGRSPAAVTALIISGACCIASPVFFAAPTSALVVFLLVWGAAVIADSGVFSTSLSEIATKSLVGTALTTQLAVGFLLTVVTVQLVPLAADLLGWRYVFVLLAPGPVIGAVAMSALHHFNTTNSFQHHQIKEESHDHQLYAPDAVRRSDSAALTHCGRQRHCAVHRDQR